MLSCQLNAPEQLEMCQTPIPQAGAGEVVIKIESALTCGTDLKTYRRGHPKFSFPFFMGHEYSGLIHQVGEGVSRFKVGDAVMGVHSAPCNHCRLCLKGYHNLCESIIQRMAWGAFSQYYKVTREIVQQNLYLRPAHVSPQRAAFLEPLACVVQGQAQIPLTPADTVVVMGCGTIGLLHIMLAKQRGAGRIIASGRHQERLQLAQTLGATDIIDVDHQDAKAEVMRLTQGYGAELVIECVGRPEAWQEAHCHACKAGLVLLFGGCPAHSSAIFDTTRLHYDQLTLKGVFHFTPADVKQSHHYLCETALPVEKILSGSAPLEHLPLIMKQLDSGQGIKYTIQP